VSQRLAHGEADWRSLRGRRLIVCSHAHRSPRTRESAALAARMRRLVQIKHRNPQELLRLVSFSSDPDGATCPHRKAVRRSSRLVSVAFASIASSLTCRDDRDTPSASSQDGGRQSYFAEKRNVNVFAPKAGHGGSRISVGHASRIRFLAHGIFFRAKTIRIATGSASSPHQRSDVRSRMTRMSLPPSLFKLHRTVAHSGNSPRPRIQFHDRM
jgi:hypothetical protein